MTTLFEQVKRKLNITWEDDETTQRVTEIIDSGIPTWKHKLGIFDPNFDFAEAGAENTLFKNYCLYEWNHCANEFEGNYHQEIADIQAKWTVEYKKKYGDSEDAEEQIQ